MQPEFTVLVAERRIFQRMIAGTKEVLAMIRSFVYFVQSGLNVLNAALSFQRRPAAAN
jgi:hypothetical protein